MVNAVTPSSRRHQGRMRRDDLVNEPPKVRFATNSPVEGDGFELSGGIGSTSKTAGFYRPISGNGITPDGRVVSQS